MMKKKVYGIPIPLHFFTPSLLFYPYKLPNNVVFFLIDKSINCINKNYINLDQENHLYFVKTLMQHLDIPFMIIDNFVIDLNRNDFELTIDEENNTLIMSDYILTNNLICITDDYSKKLIKSLNLKNDIDNNNNNNFIEQHCHRISLNTQKLEKFIFSCSLKENLKIV